jgi:hypothetical protein
MMPTIVVRNDLCAIVLQEALRAGDLLKVVAVVVG